MYHYCHHDGRQDSFLCPKGTVFNQKVFVCDWWYNADCGNSHGFYSLNEDLYSVRSRLGNCCVRVSVVGSKSCVF